MFDVDQAVVAERVDAGRADECAEFDGAFRFAHVVVDRDMTFGVNLVGVDAEFGFDIDWHKTSGYPRILRICANKCAHIKLSVSCRFLRRVRLALLGWISVCFGEQRA